MSYSCVYRDSKSRNLFNCTSFISGFLLVLLVCSNAAWSQESTPEISSLLSERFARLEQSQDTRSIDLQLFQLGYRPKAIITEEQLENGTLRITFPYYLSIPEEKKQRITDRLSSTYSYLISIQVATLTQEIILNIPIEDASTKIDELVNHFGYEGHE